MRSHTFLITLILVSGAFILPVATHAAIPFFGPIIPQKTGIFQTDVCPASFALLLQVINNIISFLITIAIVFVAPLMIAYSGFLFVVNPVHPEGMSKAKSILTNTILGIVIALAGWLIVDALMAAIYNASEPTNTTGGVLGAWTDLIGSRGLDPCLPQQGALPGATPNQAPPSSGVTAVPPTANCAVSYASILPGIAVSSTGNCCDKSQSTCTSLDGLLPNTVTQILNIQKACGGVVVTGGTETGHSGADASIGGGHSGGAKVDIANGGIDICIESNTNRIQNPSFGTRQQRDTCGNIFTLEASPAHWDIQVVNACSPI